MNYSFPCILIFLFGFPLLHFAQTNPPLVSPNLAPLVKYADVDRNDTISMNEAAIVLETYLNNPSRKIKNEIVEDVESAVIDLISYMEAINCAPIKKTAGSTRFIELYYVNKVAPKLQTKL